jgi:hypothetical protein
MVLILDINGIWCAGFYFELNEFELCEFKSWQPRFPYLILSPYTHKHARTHTHTHTRTRARASFSVYIQRSMIVIYAVYWDKVND